MNPNESKPRFTTRSLVNAGLIGAIYVVLTLIFQPISFGAIQFRIAEALTLLPILTFDAVPGPVSYTHLTLPTKA